MRKIAIVTGAGKGIGRACALKLGELGYDISIWDVDSNAAEETCDLLAQHGFRGNGLNVDVADEISVDQAVKELDRQETPLGVLVNCAGILALTPLDGLDLDVWDKILRINLRGPLVCMRAVIPLMKKLNSGAIVNIVSNVVAAARLENAAYAAAKSGLLSLTQVAALELAGHNIRVNAVSPGTTKTKLLESYSDDMLNGILKGDLERFRIGIPLKKFATPEDHANVVAFLVNESSGHITGQNIFVDGGQTLA